MRLPSESSPPELPCPVRNIDGPPTARAGAHPGFDSAGGSLPSTEAHGQPSPIYWPRLSGDVL
jgi:hypothetical protein